MRGFVNVYTPNVLSSVPVCLQSCNHSTLDIV